MTRSIPSSGGGEGLPEGWLPHDGGVCPVLDGVWVAVKFRGDPDPTKGVLRTHGYSDVLAWHHDGAEDDIIAYKLEPST